MTTLIVDAEKLVSKYLREHPAVVTLNTRIVGKTPDAKTTSWVRVVQLDASQLDTPDHFIEHYLQMDCYAGVSGGQPEVNTLARTIRAALSEIRGVYVDGTVSGARITGQARIPDDDFEPARERIALTATVWAHP